MPQNEVVHVAFVFFLFGFCVGAFFATMVERRKE